MALQTLVVCRDPEALPALRRLLEAGGLSVEVCTGPEHALELLQQHKYDAVFVDCDDMHRGPEVLRAIRRAPSNKRALAFALLNRITTMSDAFSLGAHFVLEKPITPERSLKTLHAAQGFMINERRRYFRHPVDVPVFLSFGTVRRLRCHATNLSEGGMAVRAPEALVTSMLIEVDFELPGVGDIQAEAELAWSDSQNVGLKFRHVPLDPRRRLQKWLADKSKEVGLNPLFALGQ